MATRPTKPTRKRRAPEEAREEILAAAERVLSREGPDGAGLKAVADEAGVSHALVTHYFGTYEGLVGEVFTRNNRALAAAIFEAVTSEGAPLSPSELVRRFAGLAAAPARTRLMAWAFLRGGAFVRSVRGESPLPALVDALTANAAELARAQKRPAPAREDVAMALLIGLCAIQWYGLANPMLVEAMGLPTGHATDARFQRALGAMVDAFLA